VLLWRCCCVVVKSLVESGCVQSVSCSWDRMCLVSRGLCYVCDLVTSLCQRITVPQTDHPNTSADTSAALLQATRGPAQERFTSVETNDVMTLAVTSERGLLSVSADGHVVRLWSVFKVQSVSCGQSHALVLSAIGVVFSCGLGNHGQLGHGSVESQQTLRPVEALEGLMVTLVCAGGWHSMAVSDCGDVYVWGWNEAGQLGLHRHIEPHSSSSNSDTTCQSHVVVDITRINLYSCTSVTVFG